MSKLFRRCRVGMDAVWRSSYFFLKKPITLVIFGGGGGGGGLDLLTPNLSMDSEIKRIGRNDRYSQIYGCSIATN